ncbi:MAG: ABC transporter permease [Candidatus Micrarchaeota archaeon]|nr:ABC transporter permease [Candidatus Micrarchaeota archaeon]
MKLNEKLKYIFRNLINRKIRTFLTALAIIFGVFTIVSIVAVSNGLRQEVKKQLDVLGPRTVFILPVSNVNVLSGARNAQQIVNPLTMKDLNSLKRLSELELVSYWLIQRADVSFKGERITLSIYGSEPESLVHVNPNFLPEKGRIFSSSEKGVAFIGSNVAENLFSNKIEINNKIYINGKPFVVVGILKPTGASSAGANVDDIIVINIDDARDLFKGIMKDDELTTINVVIREDFDVDEVITKVEDTLRLSRKIAKNEKNDFSILSAKSIQKQVDEVLQSITLFLGSLGAISLVVGSIGIANTMFTTILERTKEIGILKALGSSNSEILSLFLLESIMIALIGGLIGYTLSFLVGLVIQNFNLPYLISINELFIAVAISVLVGTVSGLIPAYRASRLEAVVAIKEG